jgi:formamidase
MTQHELEIDTSVALIDAPDTGHNRWHPDIRPLVRVRSDDTVVMNARDGYDGQFHRDSTAADVAAADLNRIHPLSGPVYVEEARPGDTLVVEVLEVVTGDFGCTLQFPGFGFLHEEFPDHHITHWEIADGRATSPDLPGVSIPGAPFMGVMGLAPSAVGLDAQTQAEASVAAMGHTALTPDPVSAVPSYPDIAPWARRTIAPSRLGGNVDIRQLTAGTRLHLPVEVEGALFSVGDGHFAQGDGESCGAAIETTCTVTVRLTVHKGASQVGPDGACLIFERRKPGPPDRQGTFVAIAGMPVGPGGDIAAENINVATANALRGMIDYLVAERGLTRQQAYTLCSVAVDLHISQVVDVPSPIVTAFLPLEVFTG